MSDDGSTSFYYKKRWLPYFLAVCLIFPQQRGMKDCRFPQGGVVSNAPLGAAAGRYHFWLPMLIVLTSLRLLDILASGGSAVDAAIATSLCEAVLCPHCRGLGGGFLMTVYDHKTKTAKTLNARESAPAAATENMYEHCPEQYEKGGLSMAVPGEVRGFWTAHQRYGVLPWESLFQSSIKLARYGFEVTPYFGAVLSRHVNQLTNDPGLKLKIFINPKTNKPYKVGDSVKNEKLAETLEIISKQGESALYDGELTDGFLDDIKSFNGIVTADDLKNYTPIWGSPLTTTLSGYKTLYTVAPPGSGAIVIFMLNILDGFLDLRELHTVQNWHKIIESFKFGYARRTELGDMNYAPNVTELVKSLTSKEHAKELRTKISPVKTYNDSKFYGAEVFERDPPGTANLSVIAPNGDAVALTSTINLDFGAGCLSESTGIILNDEMNDFSIPTEINAYGLPPSVANFIQPGKRPVSSMSPTIVVDKHGNVILALGAAGGSKITTSIALVLLRNLFFGETITEAVAQKRILHQLFPMQINAEMGFDEKILSGLAKKGHVIDRKVAVGFEALTALSREGGVVKGSFDPRRGGEVSLI